VVSAIGHESDRPLCDEVADLRCGTPSLAAAATVPDRAALEAHLGRLADQRRREVRRCSEVAIRRLDAVDTVGALRRGVGVASERLIRGRRRLDELHPGRELIGARRRLTAIDWRRPLGERLGRAAGRWEAEGRHLRALRPDAVLARGYAVVRRADGTVVRSAAEVASGERVDVRVARGELRALVEEAFGA
jgi:exodeoxyribonuclease VII large subunit